MARTPRWPARELEARWPDMFPMRWGPELFSWPEGILRWPAEFQGGDTLSLEEFEDDDTLVLRAEMPGIDPDEDVEISVVNHTLVIRAERREKDADKAKDSYRSEFRYGAFVRRIALPSDVSADDVKASYEDGILEIRVPIRTRDTEAKTIAITHA